MCYAKQLNNHKVSIIVLFCFQLCYHFINKKPIQLKLNRFFLSYFILICTTLILKEFCCITPFLHLHTPAHMHPYLFQIFTLHQECHCAQKPGVVSKLCSTDMKIFPKTGHDLLQDFFFQRTDKQFFLLADSASDNHCFHRYREFRLFEP